MTVQVITCVHGVHFALVVKCCLYKRGESLCQCCLTVLVILLVSSHSLASLDACFQQKHNKQIRDPLREHPKSLFVDEELVERMEAYVDSIRPQRSQSHTAKSKKHVPQVEEEDGFEHEDLKVTRSVLDSCNESFIAADEAREKASTKFFDITGLMALICRHDRVLWLVNMKSAGEKQAYALVLIELFFQHVPYWWEMGLLYDIACILHRSCLKWGFLDRYLHRLAFAVSVFHAFGHGWPCQLVYHPRKCRGFGLCDGEGCERCWKSIRFLIAYLRICGVSSSFLCNHWLNLWQYHLRIHTLDTELHHLMDANLERAGQWLFRKTQKCNERSLKASSELVSCNVDIETLREQWDLQVKAQTQPLPRESNPSYHIELSNV